MSGKYIPVIYPENYMCAWRFMWKRDAKTKHNVMHFLSKINLEKKAIVWKIIYFSRKNSKVHEQKKYLKGNKIFFCWLIYTSVLVLIICWELPVIYYLISDIIRWLLLMGFIKKMERHPKSTVFQVLGFTVPNKYHDACHSAI